MNIDYSLKCLTVGGKREVKLETDEELREESRFGHEDYETSVAHPFRGNNIIP